MYKTYIFQAPYLRYSSRSDSIIKNKDKYYDYAKARYWFVGLHASGFPLQVEYLDNYIYERYKRNAFFGHEVFLVVNADEGKMKIVHWDRDLHAYRSEPINEREFDELSIDEYKTIEKQLAKFVSENEKKLKPTNILEKEFLF